MELLRIEEIEKQDEYWDLEIEDNHNFFANGILVHNSNAGVSYQDGKILAFSRTNIITPLKDNAGFANFVSKNEIVFKEFFNQIIEKENINTDENYITIYGEWAGKGIQKGVGICNIEKSMFIFGVKVTPKNEEIPSYWIDYEYLHNTIKRVYNISKFKTFKIDIDFNNTELSQNELNELTLEVEDRCPVSEYFCPDKENLIGEGIVWTCNYKGAVLRFKVKGSKHSKSRVKTLKKLTPEELEKLSKADKCAEEIFKVQRANQALTEIFGIDFEKDIDIKKIGEYLKWVSTDTIKEELDIIQGYDLEPKDVMKKVQEKYKKYFLGIYKS